MRVTSDFWVSALIRRLQKQGGFAAVIRRGATDAGAIFLISRSRMGALSLFGPAPQADYTESRPAERMFTSLVAAGSQADIDARLERELRFDPDVWVVELEVEDSEIADLLEVRRP